MMEFRIWAYSSLTREFRPTEFFARASKLEHIEVILNTKIGELGKPCIIVISGLNSVLEK